jgi:hypothetical protein
MRNEPTTTLASTAIPIGISSQGGIGVMDDRAGSRRGSSGTDTNTGQ